MRQNGLLQVVNGIFVVDTGDFVFADQPGSALAEVAFEHVFGVVGVAVGFVAFPTGEVPVATRERDLVRVPVGLARAARMRPTDDHQFVPGIGDDLVEIVGDGRTTTP
jgi:hypothetical protein